MIASRIRFAGIVVVMTGWSLGLVAYASYRTHAWIAWPVALLFYWGTK